MFTFIQWLLDLFRAPVIAGSILLWVLLLTLAQLIARVAGYAAFQQQRPWAHHHSKFPV